VNKTYTIGLTRTVSRTETVEVDIEADSPEEARRKMLDLPTECNESCPDGVIEGDIDEIGDWEVESVNSEDADQDECLSVLLGRKAA
jgi:hypothetical protein